ncbi:MAG: TlpA disulfide reductase family protein [Pyrinomonadaceae bacterium]
MTRRQELKLFAAIGVFTTLVFVCAVSFGQTRAKSPKTIFIDAEGKFISNNEFVDLRLANPSEKDISTKTVLDDGTTEFRLAAVPQEGTVAPVFEAPVMGGKTVNTDQLKGKVLVLNFWFIGCAGCISEMPKLNDLAAKYGSNADIEFIAIAPNTEQELRDFLTRERFDYKMVGQARSIINLFAFKGFPRNIVIGRDGKIAYWRTTVKAWNKFDSVIQAELAKN